MVKPIQLFHHRPLLVLLLPTGTTVLLLPPVVLAVVLVVAVAVAMLRMSQKEQGPQQQQPAVLKDGEGRRPTILLSSDDVVNKPKKPRDTRLHECFIVTPVLKDDTDQQGGGGGVKIVCKYCHDYVKVLQKFNPTKAREHLTARCTGVDEALKIALLDSTQSAVKKRSTVNINAAAAPADQLRVVPSSSFLASTTMDKVCRPPSSAILSFYPDNNVVAEFLVRSIVL